MSNAPKTSIVGQVRRLYTETPFTDADTSAPIDPDTVSCIITNPAGIITEAVYNTAPELIRDDVGQYHLDVEVDQAGTWWYAFSSTGDGQAADEKYFIAKERHTIAAP